MDRWMERWVNRWLGGWMDRCKGKWVVGQDEWMDR